MGNLTPHSMGSNCLLGCPQNLLGQLVDTEDEQISFMKDMFNPLKI